MDMKQHYQQSQDLEFLEFEPTNDYDQYDPSLSYPQHNRHDHIDSNNNNNHFNNIQSSPQSSPQLQPSTSALVPSSFDASIEVIPTFHFISFHFSSILSLYQSMIAQS